MTIDRTTLEIKLKTNTEQEDQPLIRYAFACQTLKTWFISKEKSLLWDIPLLYVLKCQKTNEKLRNQFSYPTIGDVVATIENEKLLVIGKSDFYENK